MLIKAKRVDKPRVVQILTEAFIQNKSVLFVLGNDEISPVKITHLMEYSFEVCFRYGEIFFDKDKACVALTIYPEIRRNLIYDLKLNFWLIRKCIGIKRINKISKRAYLIKKTHPKNSHTAYLWYIGVEQYSQQKGIGTHTIIELIAYYQSQKRTMLLETSTEANILWYQKLGFKCYHTLEYGCKLYFFSKNAY